MHVIIVRIENGLIKHKKAQHEMYFVGSGNKCVIPSTMGCMLLEIPSISFGCHSMEPIKLKELRA